MKEIITGVSLFLLAVCACKQEDNSKAKGLIGEWHGVSWKVNDTEMVNDSTNLVFLVSKEGVYNLIFGDRAENGDWHVNRDTMFLVPESTEDVKLTILELTANKAKFSLNRGQKEIVEFKK